MVQSGDLGFEQLYVLPCQSRGLCCMIFVEIRPGGDGES